MFDLSHHTSSHEQLFEYDEGDTLSVFLPYFDVVCLGFLYAHTPYEFYLINAKGRIRPHALMSNNDNYFISSTRLVLVEKILFKDEKKVLDGDLTITLKQQREGRRRRKNLYSLEKNTLLADLKNGGLRKL